MPPGRARSSRSSSPATTQGTRWTTASISSLSFQPDVVIIKGDLAQGAVIRTSTMAGDLAKPMTGGALAPNLIQSLDPSGFTIGTNATVNSNAGCPCLCTAYWFTAFKAGPSTMKVGTYTGNGLAGGQSIAGIGLLTRAGLHHSGKRARRRSTGRPLRPRRTILRTAAAPPAWISSLNVDGFTVTTTDTHVNANGVVYHYVAWNQIPGHMRVGTYAGNNADNRNITGVGFEPEYLDRQAIRRRRSMRLSSRRRSAEAPTRRWGSSPTANITPGNNIQALQPDGFQIGSGTSEVNANGATYAYYAWKRPQASALTLTAVRLTAFDATRYDRGVLLKWRTGYEIDNLGFHVYREVNGQRTRVTRSLVAGSGLMAGQGAAVNGEQRYAMWDTALPLDPIGGLLSGGSGLQRQEHVARTGDAGGRRARGAAERHALDRAARSGQGHGQGPGPPAGVPREGRAAGSARQARRRPGPW